MKKLALLLLAVSALAGNISAQDKNTNLDTREQFLIGAKLGFNFSNVYDPEGQDFKADSKLGLAVGGFISIPIVKVVSIQPEVLFSQKGFHGTGTILGGHYNFTRTSNFIDVPVFFAFKPSKFLTLLVGPQYSYLIKQTDVFANATTSIAQEQEFQNANLRKNMLCFVGGVDVNLMHFVLSARGGWDVQKNNGDGTSTAPKYKNTWLQATLGYRLYY